jgi:hypothetical protein
MILKSHTRMWKLKTAKLHGLGCGTVQRNQPRAAPEKRTSGLR